jgi:hypothetical protein
MARASEAFSMEATIASFMGDASRCSMELPPMSPAQRKHAKAFLEHYPELSSESYGFGKDRKLHLFKRSSKDDSAPAGPSMRDVIAGGVGSAVNVKNTFIDDWTAPEEEPLALKTLPAYLPTNTVQCVMDGPVCKLDLSSVRDSDCSTADPCSSPSECSPASTARDSLPDWFRLPPGLELEVQNTFVHFKNTPVDERQVQSMPRSMFRKCLLLEALISQPEDTSAAPPPCPPAVNHEAEEGSLPVGTEIVIEGLSKCKSFNGLRGTVQSFDRQSGRYCILLACPPVCGAQTAMLKRENCRPIPLEAGAEVVIEGLAKCPAFNNLAGTVQSFEEQCGRYKVLLPGKETAMLKRENLRLAPLAVGTEVVLEGLSKCPAFNGLAGTVQSFEAQSGRYNIVLSSPVHGCRSTMVKRSNFRLA